MLTTNDQIEFIKILLEFCKDDAPNKTKYEDVLNSLYKLKTIEDFEKV